MARPRKPKPQDPQVLESFGTYLRDHRPTKLDPIEYLEEQRLKYMVELEEVADAALRNGDWDLRRRTLETLSRFTSLNKLRLDVTASNLGLLRGPDLSRLTAEQIAKIEQATPEELEQIAQAIKGDQTDGTTGTS